MAWVATDDFDSYTNGATVPTLNGGTGWSAGYINDFQGTNCTISNSAPYQGANAMSVASGTDGVVRRDLASAVSGTGNIFYFAFKKSTTTAGQTVFYLKNGGNANTRLKVQLGSSGNLELVGATTVTVMTSFSANTWYAIRVTFDVTANTAVCAFSTNAFGPGGSFSADSSAVTMSSTGNIDSVTLSQEAGTAIVSGFDYISPTSPFAGSAATAVVHNLGLLGVGQ